MYGVRELADWDPMTPEAIFRSLRASTGQPAGAVGAPLILCPAIDNATVARRYGVGFILEYAASPRPRGTVFVTTVRNEKLYRVPHAAAATLSRLGADGALPPADAPGTAVPVAHPDAAAWKLSTDAAVPSVLRLHLADVPGWHAAIDGHPLALESLSGSMIQARVPAGRHTVVLRYWPSAFTAGIVLAIVALAGLLAGIIVETRLRRRGPAPRRRGSDSASQ